MLATSEGYPETLSVAISAIQNALPTALPQPVVMEAINAQADFTTSMARHLESLAAHYDQMARSLRDSEAGEVFTEDDLQG
jgi:autophagy-related protein 17